MLVVDTLAWTEFLSGSTLGRSPASDLPDRL